MSSLLPDFVRLCNDDNEKPYLGIFEKEPPALVCEHDKQNLKGACKVTNLQTLQEVSI